jgi:hypothetical protein
MGLGFQSTNDPNMIQAQAQLQAALSAPIPRFYINGIGIAMTGSDLILTALWNGNPVSIINLAIPTAKGIAEDLAKAVTQYEETSEQSVKTLGQIVAAMQRAAEKPKEPSE